MTRPIDEILNLMDELSVWSDSEIVDQAYSAIQHAMSRLEDQFSFSHGTILQSLSVNRVDLGYRSVLIFQGQKELFFLLTVFLYGLQRQAHL